MTRLCSIRICPSSPFGQAGAHRAQAGMSAMVLSPPGLAKTRWADSERRRCRRHWCSRPRATIQPPQVHPASVIGAGADQIGSVASPLEAQCRAALSSLSGDEYPGWSCSCRTTLERRGAPSPGVLAFTGSIGPTDAHAHHAVQVITATSALTVLDGHGARHVGTKVVVPADAPHQIEVGAQEGTVVFLEPESAPGRAAHSRAVHFGWTVTLCLVPLGDKRCPRSSTS